VTGNGDRGPSVETTNPKGRSILQRFQGDRAAILGEPGERNKSLAERRDLGGLGFEPREFGSAAPAAGTRILRNCLESRGAAVIEMASLAPAAICDELVDRSATALLLLVGTPEPAVSIVKAVRSDDRLSRVMIGAPAGQPEFPEWAALLAEEGAEISFLRYLPERLGPLGARVEKTLRERLAQAPSFVAFEGYDTVLVLAQLLRAAGADRAHRGTLAASFN
jgi:hypothetical protein